MNPKYPQLRPSGPPYPLPPGELLYPRTEAADTALRALQQDAGLRPDGVFGPATWAALTEAAQ